MPHRNHNSFAHLWHLPLEEIEEESVRRSLLSNQLMPRLDRKPCGEIDIPMRGERNSMADDGNSQIAKTSFSLNIGKNLSSLRLSQEALDSINEQLRRGVMQKLNQNLHQLYISLEHVRQSAEAEQCIASLARSANVSLNDAFEMCDRFLSRHRMSWEMLAQFLADGRIRRFDNELALVMQLPTPANPRFIGDETCEFNARSPHIRCAVNPCGPCEGCVHRGGKD